MIGFYNYTVILTYIGLSSGIIGIFNALEKNTTMAIYCLMISGLCDMFDGLIAKTKQRTEQEKKFGIQIDSLTDLICFGVLPVIIGYSLGMSNWYYYFIFIGYILSALIRLAYFNVNENYLQSTTNQTRKFYEGLTVNSIALILPLLYFFSRYFGKYFSLIYASILLCLSFAFLIKFRLKKFNLKGLIILMFIGFLELFLIVLFK